MADIISICISSVRKPVLIGDHDIRSVTFCKEGLCIVEQSSRDIDDEFTLLPIGYSFEIDPNEFSAICTKMCGNSDDATGYYYAEVGYSDGHTETARIKTDSDAVAFIFSRLGNILDFEERPSEPIRLSCYTPEIMDRSLKSGKISEEVYRSNIERIRITDRRRSVVESSIGAGTYPFIIGPEQLIKDMKDGFLTDDQYNMFAWFCRNRNGSDRSAEFISLKLRFSVWGQRLLGKYDTYEYLLDREESEVVDRRYSVHGTLFEGCGNYKAPDDAEHIPLEKERTHLVFRYLGVLLDRGILGKDHSESKFDCAFFDLYIRFSDSPSLHTKGTSEYPYFIKMLMYLMKQDLSSIY